MNNFIKANTEFILLSLDKFYKPQLLYCALLNRYFVTLHQLNKETIKSYHFELIR